MFKMKSYYKFIMRLFPKMFLNLAARKQGIDHKKIDLVMKLFNNYCWGYVKTEFILKYYIISFKSLLFIFASITLAERSKFRGKNFAI